MAEVQRVRSMELEAMDSTSPFYINPADLQKGALVSPELTDGNYTTWRRSFELALSIKNKTGFVDGSIPQPEGRSSQYTVWKRCDNLVRSWLQRSVSITIASTIFFLDTAKEIWDELQERYGVPDDVRICHLQQQYYGLVQGTKTVSVFYSELLSLLRELKNYRPPPQCNCKKM